MFAQPPTSVPTTSHGAPFFYCGAPQDEALARLHFLVDEHLSCGLLIGAPGAGKSSVLCRFAQELRRAGGESVLLDLVGRDSHELLWGIANGLGARVDERDSRFSLWRAVSDRLYENVQLNIPTAILCDHVDLATDDALAAIIRLLHVANPGTRGPTVIASTSTENAGHLPRQLIAGTDLRADLDPWTEDDVAGYLDARRMAAGPHAPRIDRHAAGRVWELSQGLPRAAARLTDLALIASQGQRSAQVSTQTIDAVHRELAAVA